MGESDIYLGGQESKNTGIRVVIDDSDASSRKLLGLEDAGDDHLWFGSNDDRSIDPVHDTKWKAPPFRGDPVHDMKMPSPRFGKEEPETDWRNFDQLLKEAREESEAVKREQTATGLARALADGRLDSREQAQFRQAMRDANNLGGEKEEDALKEVINSKLADMKSPFMLMGGRSHDKQAGVEDRSYRLYDFRTHQSTPLINLNLGNLTSQMKAEAEGLAARLSDGEISRYDRDALELALIEAGVHEELLVETINKQLAQHNLKIKGGTIPVQKVPEGQMIYIAPHDRSYDVIDEKTGTKIDHVSFEKDSDDQRVYQLGPEGPMHIRNPRKVLN